MNKKSGSSYSHSSKAGLIDSKKVYTAAEMEEMERKLADVWKVYGRDKAIGRDLYQLYGRHHKPEVNAPVPATKPWDYKQAALKEKKPCPQQAKVEYPKVVTKQDLARIKDNAKVTKLDAIPKRRPYHEILQELQEVKKMREAYVPRVLGLDRENMINSLQDKFKYAHKGKGPQLTAEEEMKIQLAMEAQMRRVSKKNYFGDQGLLKEKTEEIRPVQYQNKVVNDLNNLFDDVVAEIEERQEYLAEIEHLDMEAAKEKVKAEIASRVAELQKINRMLHEEKTKASQAIN